MKQFIGIDPGASGGFAVIDTDGRAHAQKFGDLTERDIWDAMKEWTLSPLVALTCLERVGSMPGQGVASSFKFGTSYGFLRGVLAASRVPYELVGPQTWQKSLGCLTKGDKNVSKAKAQQLFPSLKITHAIADALLLAEYAKRTFASREAK